MDRNLRVEVSRYMSYLLRHDSEGLKMDKCGFVDVTEFLKKIQDRFHVDQAFVTEIVEKSSGRRFEIAGNKIKALYGHTIPVEHHFQEDKTVQLLYHGTTPEAASKILEDGLKPMRRKWVHLSSTKAIAVEVGLRRTKHPIALEIDAKAAREKGLSFYRATDKVYLSGFVPARHIRIIP
jgi:putative RNA 2'-phosphotransferase